MAPIRTDYGALREHLIIPQGAYWQRSWQITDPANAQLLALSGWSARCQIRDNPTPTAPVLFEWNTTAGTGIGVITLAIGLLTLTLEGSESAAWTFRRGVFDLRLTDPSGHATPVVEGKALVIPSVTH